jgi:hypothetical protein
LDGNREKLVRSAAGWKSRLSEAGSVVQVVLASSPPRKVDGSINRASEGKTAAERVAALA